MATDTQPTKRTDLDLNHFRELLLEEKRLAEETIAATIRAENSPTADGEESDKDGLGTVGAAKREELSNVDNHPADVATELFLREEDMALEGNARDIIAQVNRALQKIDDGTYGLSDRSGKPIPAERLEALPYATLTVEEQD